METKMIERKRTRMEVVDLRQNKKGWSLFLFNYFLFNRLCH